MLKPLVMLCFKLHWYIFIYVETIGYDLKLHWYLFIYVETIGYVMF